MTLITKPRNEKYKKTFAIDPEKEDYIFKLHIPRTDLFSIPKESEIYTTYFVHETEMGLLCQCGNYQEIWLPISQLRNFHRKTYKRGEKILIDISLWILKQNEKIAQLKLPYPEDYKFLDNRERDELVSIDGILVKGTNSAILFYDKYSDLDHWCAKSLIKVKDKSFNSRKGKKLKLYLPKWWVKQNLEGKEYNP